METLINKLKIEYQAITPPEKLANGSLDDLWLRVDAKPVHNFRYLYSFAVILIAFIILAGGVAFVSTKAKPGSTFYPIKTLTNNVVNTVNGNNNPVKEFYNSEIEQKKVIKRKLTPTPTISPIPSVAPWEKLENKNSKKFDWKSSVSEEKATNLVNPTQGQSRDIKGAWTHRYQPNPSSSFENSEQRSRNHSGNRYHSNFGR